MFAYHLLVYGIHHEVQAFKGDDAEKGIPITGHDYGVTGGFAVFPMHGYWFGIMAGLCLVIRKDCDIACLNT